MDDALEKHGILFEVEEVAVLGPVYRIDPANVKAALAVLKGEGISGERGGGTGGFDFLVDLFGVDTGSGVDAVYHVRSLGNGDELFVKAAHPYGGVLESVWNVYTAALLPEREMCEMYGLLLSGHPNPKRLLTTDGCAPLLLKEQPIRSADEVRDRDRHQTDIDPANLARKAGFICPDDELPDESEDFQRPRGIRRADYPDDLVATEPITLNMGPQHPSTHGVMRLLVEVNGEEIVSGEADVGYLHRGIEKLAESRQYNAVGTLLDRGDYITGIHNELAMALATEKLMGIDPSPKAKWIRCLMGELNRIASHMIWLGPNTLDSGLMGLFLYVLNDREQLLDILDEITGSRMMFNYVRPGGVVRDLPAGIDGKIRTFLESFRERLEEHYDFAVRNEIFQARINGIAKLDHPQAVAFSLTGANLRSSGGIWDVRKNHPYDAYADLDFEVPTATGGDIAARFEMRFGELRQSMRIIEQCLDGMPEGDPTSEIPKRIKPPTGEAYAAVEAPRGEMGVHLVSDGTTTPYRMRYRPPTLYALGAGEYLLPGMMIADVVVGLGSLDFVLGEIDR